MKVVLICLFITGLVSHTSALSSNHLLSRIEPMFKEMVRLYQAGDHSDAFSAIMSAKVRLDELHSEMGFSHTASQPANLSCNELLSGIVGQAQLVNWHEAFERMESMMDQIANKCTSSDFTSTSVRGFDNSCALCVVILQVMEGYWKYHLKNLTEFVNKEFCGLFDGVVKPTCQAFVHYAGPVIINALINNDPADLTCIRLKLCTNPKCRLSSTFAPDIQADETLKGFETPSWQWLVDLFTKRFGDGHLPPFDMDNDSFSDISTFRGYHWKGADCDELNPNIYPGRKEAKNKVLDHDCNGIYGKSNSTGQAFETILCDNTNRLGVAVVGDSAGAHFSIPEKYFNASDIKKGTYHDILRRVADELDLPFESGYTAHTVTNDYVSHSVYKYLRNWNLCNNNDYQNLGVNGGDSGNSWGNIKALKRDPENDHPLLVFFELIGNDVCAKSFDGMTTEAEFEKNVLRLLNWLDTTLPTGSHIWVYGLADGQLLYDNLHSWTHPLNVTYAQVYDFLNCLKISPCWGWLNTNATVRRFTTDRAKNLTKVYKKIMSEHTFQNFDMVYYEFPAVEILQRRFDEGGIPQDMIERCDGFHPNGLFHSYLADWTWNKLQLEHPDWIGMQNPHNDEIIARFGLKPYL